MGIISWIVLGLLVGVLAKWIMPGKDDSGIIVTIILGIVGSLVGGFAASLLGIGAIEGFTIGSILISVAGALLVLFVYSKLRS